MLKKGDTLYTRYKGKGEKARYAVYTVTREIDDDWVSLMCGYRIDRKPTGGVYKMWGTDEYNQHFRLVDAHIRKKIIRQRRVYRKNKCNN